MTTNDLATHILDTAPEYDGWSIVESPNSQGKFNDLINWAAEMSLQTWRRDLSVRSKELGLVLLWLESEIIRKKGGEATVWPILSNRELVPWNAEIYSQLFTKSRQVTQLHRNLLKCAAQFYGIRNTFNEPDALNYYRLIYLQFGFTYDDAINRLKEWLSGKSLPFSIQHLLEAKDSGAIQFQQAWKSLRLYRLRNITKNIIEKRLGANPWVLPEWMDSLLKASEKSSAQFLESSDIESAELNFFTLPCLRFSENGEPCFYTSLCNLSELALKANEYELNSGEHFIAKLIRQNDGAYHSNAREFVALPILPKVLLSLVDERGNIALHGEAMLWDTAEEVTIYSAKSGRIIPSGSGLRSGVEVYAIASSDIKLNAEVCKTFDLGLGYRIYHVNGGWQGVLQACLDDDVVWESNNCKNSSQLVLNGLNAEFTEVLDLRETRWNQVNPPWKLPLKISIPAGWQFSRLRWRRADGQRMEFNSVPEYLTLLEKDSVSSLILRVRVTNGVDFVSNTLRLKVPFVATLRWDKENNPYRNNPEKTLVLREAAKFTWSFSLFDKKCSLSDSAIRYFLEGGTLQGRLKSKAMVLPSLDGYGASLRITDDPYHPGNQRCSPGNPIMEVSSTVIDGGIMGNVFWDAEEGVYHIRSSLTDLSREHQLLAWFTAGDALSMVSEVASENLTQEEAGWRWRPDGQIQLHAVALFFRGVRLGSWFDWDSAALAVINAPEHKASEIAAVLRIWHAPLLSENMGARDSLRKWFTEYWPDVLPVWLSSQPVRGSSGFLWSANLSEKWNHVVNDFFILCLPAPSADSASQIISMLAPDLNGINAFGCAIFKLAEDACPIFAARITKKYFDNYLNNKDKNTFIQRALALTEMNISDDRADEIGKIHGNRDGYWLSSTIPSLNGDELTPRFSNFHAYRLLSKNRSYRLYAFGRFLSQMS